LPPRSMWSPFRTSFSARVQLNAPHAQRAEPSSVQLRSARNPTVQAVVVRSRKRCKAPRQIAKLDIFNKGSSLWVVRIRSHWSSPCEMRLCVDTSARAVVTPKLLRAWAFEYGVPRPRAAVGSAAGTGDRVDGTANPYPCCVARRLCRSSGVAPRISRICRRSVSCAEGCIHPMTPIVLAVSRSLCSDRGGNLAC
jgi:hypothetical protein